MSDQDVLTLLKFVPRYKEIDIYVETDVSLVEKHMLLVRVFQSSQGLVIEQIVEYYVVSSPVKKNKGKLFLLEWYN